jgi:hypothetical protein
MLINMQIPCKIQSLKFVIGKRAVKTTDIHKLTRTNFFLNNQPDPPIIQIYSVIKFYVFRTSSLSITRSFILYIQDGTPGVPYWLCLEAVIKKLRETYQCRMYSRKLQMVGREDARNM